MCQNVEGILFCVSTDNLVKQSECSFGLCDSILSHLHSAFVGAVRKELSAIKLCDESFTVIVGNIVSFLKISELSLNVLYLLTSLADLSLYSVVEVEIVYIFCDSSDGLTHLNLCFLNLGLNQT